MEFTQDEINVLLECNAAGRGWMGFDKLGQHIAIMILRSKGYVNGSMADSGLSAVYAKLTAKGLVRVSDKNAPLYQTLEYVFTHADQYYRMDMAYVEKIDGQFKLESRAFVDPSLYLSTEQRGNFEALSTIEDIRINDIEYTKENYDSILSNTDVWLSGMNSNF